jgi:hypothetical protein
MSENVGASNYRNPMGLTACYRDNFNLLYFTLHAVGTDRFVYSYCSFFAPSRHRGRKERKDRDNVIKTLKMLLKFIGVTFKGISYIE